MDARDQFPGPRAYRATAEWQEGVRVKYQTDHGWVQGTVAGAAIAYDRERITEIPVRLDDGVVVRVAVADLAAVRGRVRNRD